MFADIRTEWRVNDIEKSLHQKAENHKVDSLCGDVDRLERTVREISSICDGLRSELEAVREEVRCLREQVIPELN
jgi:hypothetical protein